MLDRPGLKNITLAHPGGGLVLHPDEHLNGTYPEHQPVSLRCRSAEAVELRGVCSLTSERDSKQTSAHIYVFVRSNRCPGKAWTWT